MTDEEFNKADLLSAILNRCNDIEAVGEEAVEIAIDATIAYVVDWLQGTGYKAKAQILEGLADL